MSWTWITHCWAQWCYFQSTESGHTKQPGRVASLNLVRWSYLLAPFLLAWIMTPKKQQHSDNHQLVKPWKNVGCSRIEWSHVSWTSPVLQPMRWTVQAVVEYAGLVQSLSMLVGQNIHFHIYSLAQNPHQTLNLNHFDPTQSSPHQSQPTQPHHHWFESIAMLGSYQRIVWKPNLSPQATRCRGSSTRAKTGLLQQLGMNVGEP